MELLPTLPEVCSLAQTTDLMIIDEFPVKEVKTSGIATLRATPTYWAVPSPM